MGHIAIAKSFFRYGKSDNPPYPPLKKGWNYKELLLKSPFEKGGFRNLQTEGIYGKRYRFAGCALPAILSYTELRSKGYFCSRRL